MLAPLSVNEISKRRKEEVKVILPTQYKKIANPKPDKTKVKLFGEELNEDVKVCEDEAKMTTKLKSIDYYQGRFVPYKKQKGRGRYMNPSANDRQHGYWNAHYNQNQLMPLTPPPTQYQCFQQAPPNFGPPQTQYQPRPYNYRGHGQRRTNAKQ